MPRLLFALLVAIVASTVYFFSKTWLPALAGSGGAVIDHQLTLNFILLGVVFCATQVALGLFVWKYREQKISSGTAKDGQPGVRVELAWLTLAAALFLGLNVMGAMLKPQPSSPLSASPTFVEVTGVQFRWYFRYAGPDGKFGRTIPEFVDTAEGNPLGIDHSDPAAADDVVSTSLIAPTGQDLILELRAQDVIHSFYVPSARLKQDAVPGQEVRVPLPSLTVGTYDIACAQLCGMGHYQMNAKLKVVPEAEYRAWLAQSAPSVAKR
jgi:cytochrome c oxidase subunit 2